MSTAIDMLLVAPFISLLAPGMRWVFWASVAAALLVAEFFSSFPFGVITLALLGGWLSVRFLLVFFDISSFASIVIAFVVGVYIETALVSSFFILEQGSISAAIILRGGVFAARQFLAGLFVFALIMGIRAAYAVGIYAMAEEKNPFA
jgi:hypothetical protein